MDTASLLISIGGAILGTLAFVLALNWFIARSRGRRTSWRPTQSARITPAAGEAPPVRDNSPGKKYRSCRERTLERGRRWVHSFVKIDSRTRASAGLDPATSGWSFFALHLCP